MASIARALRHRNFRLFLSGQLFALIGYWMQSVAQGWLIYRITGSATLLGMLGFASSLPVLVIAPLAGLWSDRWNRHRAMFIVQILEMIGFGMLVTSVSVNMILQTIVKDDKRGRIMSLYTAAFLGMSPFGSLIAGAMADRIGIAATLTAGGVCCALAAAYTYSRRREMHAYMRPIYDRLGIARRKAASQDFDGSPT